MPERIDPGHLSLTILPANGQSCPAEAASHQGILHLDHPREKFLRGRREYRGFPAWMWLLEHDCSRLDRAMK
jgi:hypothetical protein